MTPFFEIAGWTLIHFVWQGALVAAVTAAALRLAQRRSPNARYMIACAGLVLMLAAPIATARLLSSDEAAPRAAGHWTRSLGDSTGTERGADRSANQPPPRLRRSAGGSAKAEAARSIGELTSINVAQAFRPAISVFADARGDQVARAITIVWLLGVAVLSGRMIGGWWVVRRLHRAALVASASSWQHACDRIATRLGLKSAAHVVESALVDVPTVIGWLRPAILLPVAALSTLSPAQVEAILAHELAHVRRHDYLVNLLQSVAETLLFYHPAVWWLSARVRAEREHCCDEVAVRICGDAVGYARALAELEAWRAEPGLLAVAATGGSLLDRVRRILRAPAADEPRSSWAATIVLTTMFTAGAGSVQYLPLFPAFAGNSAAAAQWIPAPPPTPPVPAMPALPPVPPVPPAPTEVDSAEPSVPPAPPVSPVPPVPPVPSVATSYEVQPPPPPPPPPPAPPAPPAPGGFSLNNSDTRMTWHDGSARMDITLHGKIAFNDDLSDVQSLSDGGSLKIRVWKGLVPHTIEITSRGGTLKREYFNAGISRPWDAEARAMLAEYLLMLVRQSALGAESRVKSIFAKKGVDGVLAEIQLLTGDYARRIYLSLLVDNAWFDTKTVVPLLQIVDDRMSSDYDRRVTLEKILDRIPLEEPATTAVVAVIDKMRSSYDKRLVLSRLIAKDTMSLEGKAAVLATTVSLNSDYDRRLVLEAYLQKFGIEARTRQPFAAAVGVIRSDYDRRLVLTKFAEKSDQSADSQRIAFDLIGAMRSDYDRAESLIAYLRTHAIDAAARPAFVAAAERISSSYDQNRVLAALVKAERR